MEEIKNTNQKTELQILLEEHPELMDMILKYINGNDFRALYKQYFLQPVNNCINACVKKFGKSYIYSITRNLLDQLGFKDFRSYAENVIIDSIFYNAEQKSQNESRDLFVILNELFTKSLSTNEFKEYIITILSASAKDIGMGYINLLMYYLNEQTIDDSSYMPDDDYELS